jgi:dsDNA-binding SOS-regulon protein
MPNTIDLSRTGQLNGNTADDRAAFITLSTTEVISAFNRACIFKDLVMSRPLQRGRKGEEFPVLGRKKARYHTTGQSVLTNLNNSPADRAKEVINIDGLMIALEVVDDMDALLDFAAPQVRQETNEQLGQALAEERDSRTARVLFACSKRNTPQLQKASDADRVGTTRTLSAGYANATKAAKGNELVSIIGDLKTAMKRKNVPWRDMTIVVPPEEYEFLQEGDKVLNADYNANASNGSIREGAPNLRVKGIPVLESNAVNQEAYVLQAGDRGNSEYQQDMSKCRMLMFHKSAIGVLTLLNPQFQMTSPNGDFNFEYQAQGVMAKMAIGMKSLRPEAAASVSIP